MRRTRILTAVLALAAGLPAGTPQQSTQTWTPLLDSVGWDDWGHTDVVSLASDAVDPDRVGASVTARNVGWNGTVAAGSSVSFGFTGDWPGNSTRPASFKLGDRGCTVT
ncbi:cellulose binding domain-containing protein [Streptomyces sp. NPDC101171]|uniref:cellulose binding domain-containing protein n=1 Tax=Streptomyces sp. NPDC101171 TaxID=3366122 RepID=UPI003804DD0E